MSSHLKQCSACRQRQQNFEMVDRALLGVVGDSAQRVDAVAAPVVSLTAKPKTGSVPTDRIHWKRRLATIGSLAGAAVAALVMMNWNVVENDVPRVRVDLTTPVVKLAKINSQRMQDQELLRESLELDVRTLKLQTLSLDDERADEMLDRIELLLNRIKQAKVLENENYWEL